MRVITMLMLLAGGCAQEATEEQEAPDIGKRFALECTVDAAPDETRPIGAKQTFLVDQDHRIVEVAVPAGGSSPMSGAKEGEFERACPMKWGSEACELTLTDRSIIMQFENTVAGNTWSSTYTINRANGQYELLVRGEKQRMSEGGVCLEVPLPPTPARKS